MEGSRRKRAAIACNYCRKRKRKCDGKRPICTLCEESNHSPCEYRDSQNQGNQDDPAAQTASILSRLDALEQSYHSTLWSLSSGSGPVLVPDTTRRPASSLAELSPQVTPASIGDIGSGHSNFSGHGGTDGGLPPPPSLLTQPQPQLAASSPGAANAAMAIPPSHSTTTSDLLRTTAIRKLLGEYPPDTFLHTELRRPVPEVLRLTPMPLSQVEIPTIEPECAEAMIQCFFASVHKSHPILSETEFRNVYNTALEQSFPPSIDTALVLSVLALAAVSSSNATTEEGHGSKRDEWMPGSHFVGPAVQILLTEAPGSFGGNLPLAQGLYLCSVYYGFLSRPLQSWRLAHMASTEAQSLWIRQSHDTPTTEPASMYQAILRLSWAVFVLECDVLAEHHLAQSGIENLVEQLPFPAVDNEGYMFRWLANISSRRLLNRTHYILYDRWRDETDVTHGNPSSSSGVPRPLFGVSQELDRQLHAWFDLLPSEIKPDLEDEGAMSPEDTVLMMRFHATGDIIYRPFLHQVCDVGLGPDTSPEVIENARKCLHHCRGYLDAFQHISTAPTASLEVFLHSTMAATLLLTLGALYHVPSPPTTSIIELQARSIKMLERWAFPGSSIEAMLLTLRITQAKCIGKV